MSLPDLAQPCMAWPDRNAFWRVISQFVQNIEIRNFYTMWIPVLKLSYQILY